MARWFFCLNLVLATLLLTACAVGPRPIHQAAIPTIGPVQQGSGGPGSPHIELRANTNCAEVGGVITFTTAITNEMNVPITFTGSSPLLDMVLKPRGASAPTLH